jgi:hypothetical protein
MHGISGFAGRRPASRSGSLWLALASFCALAVPPPAAAGGPADLALSAIATLEKPVAVRSAFDGTPRLFIVQKTGPIRIYDQKQKALLPAPFLDLTGQVDLTNHEQGLLGLVFHPDYENNGFFYVYYISDRDLLPDRAILARYQVSDDPNVADAGSALSILEVEQPSPIHKAGDMFFGQDGYLYIALGDGGPGFDPLDNAQNPATVLGKLLRLDVDQASESFSPRFPSAGRGVETCGAVANYGIPPDNPFVDDAATCDEIYFIGLRNPWRWSFDRQTGDFFIADVGQTQIEEINFIPAASTGGENLGWSCREGPLTVAFNDCLPGPLTPPVLFYDHLEGCAVVGGYRYRGSMPSLQGIYTYGDWCSGNVYFAEQGQGRGAGWTSSVWQDTDHQITAFGEDEAGELYLTADSGAILTFTSVERALFVDGFEAGFAAWSNAVGVAP